MPLVCTYRFGDSCSPPWRQNYKASWNCSLMLHLHFHMLRILMLIDESIQTLGHMSLFRTFLSRTLLPSLPLPLEHSSKFSKSRETALFEASSAQWSFFKHERWVTSEANSVLNASNAKQEAATQTHANAMDSSEQHCALLELPAELRNTIYAYTLIDGEPSNLAYSKYG